LLGAGADRAMTPWAIVGGFAGGLGLFFMGMRLLTQNLKTLADRRVRQSAERWTRGRWSGCVLGMAAGAVTQTMPALTFVVIGMLRSGILSSHRAFALLQGGNIGACVLVLLVSFDIKLAILYLLGIAPIVIFISTWRGAIRKRLQALGSALFGMGLIIFGFILLREAAAPLAGYSWFQETLAWAGRSLLLGVLVSVVLSVLVQSSGCVLVIGIGLASAGILGVEQFLAIHIGACLGSSLSLRLLSTHLRGQARQVAMYQELTNYLMAAIFLPLYLIEAHYGVPLIKAALLSSELPLEQLLALYCFLPDLVTGALQLAFLEPLTRRLERWYPATEMELLSQPRYIHDRALEDAAGSLLLADREQRRLPEIFSHYLDSVRQGTALKPLRETARDVLTRMDEFLRDVASRFPDQAVEEHVAILTRQRLFNGLSEQILELCRLLHRMSPSTALEAWRMGIVEGIDTVLLVLNDMLNTDDPWPLPTEQLMSGRGELMSRMRREYLGVESALSSIDRTSVLQITSSAEHVFVLLSQLAGTYRESAGAGAAGAVNGLIPAVVEQPGRNARSRRVILAPTAGRAS